VNVVLPTNHTGTPLPPLDSNPYPSTSPVG
jgi:hypothetical protein